MSDENKSRIDVLTEEESKAHWDTYVSSNNRHFMLLDQTEWPARIVGDTNVLYWWLDDWNANEYSTFMQKLTPLAIAPTDTVYVFWMREICARTDWHTFTNTWINFLYEDEGCIVLSCTGKTALVLSNGHAWCGIRT